MPPRIKPRSSTALKLKPLFTEISGIARATRSGRTYMPSRARAGLALATLAILLVSAAVGMFVEWRAPRLARYSRDWLMRARGPLHIPKEIAIVAIDEASIARFGRFPWSRQV